MALSLVVAHWPSLDCELLCRNFKASRGKFRILGCAVEAAAALKLISHERPDVALISAALQGGPHAAFDVVHKLSSSRSPTPVVMLLPSSEDDMALRAFSAGAKGVISQTDGFKVVCKSLRCVHAGQIWANSHQLQIVLGALTQKRHAPLLDVKGNALLTKREEEIVRMLAEGLPNLEIASALGLSPHTVKNHLFRIYEKLGISNRTELILYALSSGRTIANEPEAPAPAVTYSPNAAIGWQDGDAQNTGAPLTK